MRFQIVASLALLQLQSFAAAASGTGANTMFQSGGNNHGMGSNRNSHGSPDGSKPNGGHRGPSMGGSPNGASAVHGAKKSKGLPRMEGFHGIHLSPVEGGVVNHLGTATVNKRVISSGVPSPDTDWYLDPDCYAIARRGAALPKRCFNEQYFTNPNDVPDPIPDDCLTCIGGADTIGGDIAKRVVPTPPPFADLTTDCPIIDRRGDFLIRRCPEETSEIPVWEQQELKTMPIAMAAGKKRAPSVSDLWTRSDGGESYFECGDMSDDGTFSTTDCPEDVIGGGPLNLEDMPTITPTEKRASGTIGGSLIPSGGPSYLDECGVIRRRGNLVVRVVCCDTYCDRPLDSTNSDIWKVQPLGTAST